MKRGIGRDAAYASSTSRPLTTSDVAAFTYGACSCALLNFAVAIAVSRMTPAPPERVQQLVEEIRVPRSSGRAVGV